MVSDEQLAAIELAMRQALCEAGDLFTTEEIYDALTNPDAPVTAWTAALPQLRSKLTPYFSECTTDDDLLRAARSPDDPLVASGACRVQVLQRLSSIDAEAFRFGPEELGQRIEADLGASYRSGGGDRQREEQALSLAAAG